MGHKDASAKIAIIVRNEEVEQTGLRSAVAIGDRPRHPRVAPSRFGAIRR
jgi:hypothetical protein